MKFKLILMELQWVVHGPMAIKEEVKKVDGDDLATIKHLKSYEEFSF